MNRLIRVFLLCVCPLLQLNGLAQTTGTAPQPAPGNSPGGANQPNPQPPNSNRTNRPPPLPETLTPLFLAGSVRLEDGTLPPDRALIERVCNGHVKPEGYTDSKGNFSFLVGGPTGIVLADASVDLSNQPFGLDPVRQSDANPRDLNGCEIRASLAGYLSTTIILAFRKPLDNPNIGVIHLRRLANNVGDFTFSVTTATASKDARNAYEKGLDNAKKQKWPDAERDFLKAVQAYSRYAVAWYELGRVYQQEKKFDDAARAQNEAIKSDPKFAAPYVQLASLTALQSKWDDVVAHSSQVMKLSPSVPAEVYFVSAVAHYNLHHIEIAKDHARQAASQDSQNRIPRIHHLLGVILAQSKEYSEAAEEFRLYLKLAPNASEAGAVQQLLTEIEKAPEPSRD
jgi:tetratricopeptide (TPR) repeat protein